MNYNKKTNIMIVLLVLPFFVFGCTVNDLVGFAVDDVENIEGGFVENSIEDSPTPDLQIEEPLIETQREEEKLDLEGAKKAEEEKEKAEEEKIDLEEKKEDLEKELKDLEEKIEDTAKTIAEKEYESVIKGAGESAARNRQKERAKNDLEKLKEKQLEDIKERAGEIIGDLEKEQKLIEELGDLGEEITTEKISLTSGVAKNLINEAKELISSKNDIQKAKDNLNRVLERGTPSMQIEAGLQMVDLGLNAIKKEMYPQKIKELKNIAYKVVSIAESSVKGDLKSALSKKIEVDEVLGDISDLRDTSKRILSLDPLDINAGTKMIIAESILKMESTQDILKSIRNTKKLARLQDKEIPVELSLLEISKLLETGRIEDLRNAKEVASTIIPIIRSKTKNIKEDIFKDLGVLKSELANSITITSTDLGIILTREGKEVKDLMLKSAVIKRLPPQERVIIYSVNPYYYIDSATFNSGPHKINNAVYLIENEKVYEYNFMGRNKKIEGNEAKNIKNIIFNRMVMGGTEIPLSEEFLQKEYPLDGSPLKIMKDKVNSFFYDQVHIKWN